MTQALRLVDGDHCARPRDGSPLRRFRVRLPATLLAEFDDEITDRFCSRWRVLCAALLRTVELPDGKRQDERTAAGAWRGSLRTVGFLAPPDLVQQFRQRCPGSWDAAACASVAGLLASDRRAALLADYALTVSAASEVFSAWRDGRDRPQFSPPHGRDDGEAAGKWWAAEAQRGELLAVVGRIESEP